jgi:two-component system NtrC family response regulator
MNKAKLLIVEDDEAIRTQLKYALRDEFAVLFAADRREAISVVESERPALVSLDLGLPPHPDSADEGLQALDQVMKRAPDTKVIVLTGNGDRENAIRAVQLGAFDYHLKPIQLDDLRVVLRRAVYLQTLEADAEKHQSPARPAVASRTSWAARRPCGGSSRWRRGSPVPT